VSLKALASRKKGHQSWRVEDLKTGTPLSEALPEVWHGAKGYININS